MDNQKKTQRYAATYRKSAPHKVMKNSHNTGRVFSNWDTKCICEQQRGASTQTSASPRFVSAIAGWS